MQIVSGQGSTHHVHMHRLTTVVSALILALSIGYLHGRILALNTPELQLQSDHRSPVPVVEIEGIRNGLLHGRILGKARLKVADTVLVQSGAFVTDAAALLRNEVWVTVPTNAQFVASKRGKKYYPIHSSGGSRITPVNRIYFATEQEAKAAGYVK